MTDNPVSETKQKVYKCPHCGVTKSKTGNPFDTLSKLNTHIRAAHRDKVKKEKSQLKADMVRDLSSDDSSDKEKVDTTIPSTSSQVDPSIDTSGDKTKTAPSKGTLGFKIRQAEIIPVTNKQFGEGDELPDFTEDDVHLLMQSILNAPAAIMDNSYMLPKPDQVAAFSKQFTRYCIKKGIDPYAMLFDEFGLVMTGLPIVASVYKGYQKKETEEKIKKKKEEEKENE